jgi:ABC-type glycerol-3-phosphate transport system substrate-binding protein
MRMSRVMLAGMVILALLGGPGGAVVAQQTDEETPAPPVDIEAVADMIMQAWAPEYDEAKVEAIYDPEVLMMLDTDVLAEDREQIKAVISGALGFGNRYAQVGPVIPYEGDHGDFYLASIVEVTGAGHPTGDPLVGFYRIHDGKVVRHIFLYPPDY